MFQMAEMTMKQNPIVKQEALIQIETHAYLADVKQRGIKNILKKG
jgi:uncharacterized protein YjaG (DUF416 family)